MQKLDTIKLNKIIYWDRGQAQKLGKEIGRIKSNKVTIDFSEVVFVSRAFADEWLNMLEQIPPKKNVVLRHIKPDGKKMIQIVKKKKSEIRKQLS